MGHNPEPFGGGHRALIADFDRDFHRSYTPRTTSATKRIGDTMAAKKKLAKLKTQMEDVRGIAIETVISANKIVYEGIQRLAEHELDELQKSYKTVVDGLKASSRKGDIKSTAQAQLDLLQQTIDQIIANARTSVQIITETRTALTDALSSGLQGKPSAKKDLSTAKKQATAAAKQVRKATQTARAAAESAVDAASKQIEGAATKTATTGKRGTGRSQSTTTRKPATKRTTSRAKSTAAKSTAAKSTAAKSTAAKSTAAKSTAAKRTTTKSTAAKRSTTRKPAASSSSRVKRATSAAKSSTDKS